MKFDSGHLALLLAIIALALVAHTSNQKREILDLERENLRLSIQLKRMELGKLPEEPRTDITGWFQRMDSIALDK